MSREKLEIALWKRYVEILECREAERLTRKNEMNGGRRGRGEMAGESGRRER